ncbi:MAG: hypothetical protein PVI55_16845, partial [Desulfobacterales bacterium]
MRHFVKIMFRFVLPVAIMLISSYVPAQEQPDGDQPPPAKQDVSESLPDLADIIPKATELSGNLATLENSVT